MMKEVTRFESNDGTLFTTPAECLAHDEVTALRTAYDFSPLRVHMQSRHTKLGVFIEWIRKHPEVNAKIQKFAKSNRELT